MQAHDLPNIFWFALLGRGSAVKMGLYAYQDTWEDKDPHANFKAEVAAYTVADPLPTLENLSRDTSIPVPCLMRYVLVKYAGSGAEALLAMTPIVFQQMEQQIERAEAAGSNEARLKAYDALRQIIAWLSSGNDESVGEASNRRDLKANME